MFGPTAIFCLNSFIAVLLSHGKRFYSDERKTNAHETPTCLLSYSVITGLRGVQTFDLLPLSREGRLFIQKRCDITSIRTL